MNTISTSITPKAIQDFAGRVGNIKAEPVACLERNMRWERPVGGALYRNKIVSNMMPSAVHANPSLNIPVRDYLGSVLPGLSDFPISRIAELTPAVWATRNKPTKSGEPEPCVC